MNPDLSRVAAVIGARQGSGYLVGSRLVLTAAHVVEEQGTAEAVVIGGFGEVLCDVVWRRKDKACDAALLVARADLVPDAVSSRFAPLRWGELVRLDIQENCTAIGFPQVQRDESGELDSDQLDGRVKPGSGILRGRYALDISGIPPQSTADGSPWSGLSGAGLFCGGALIGVVATAPTRWQNGRLEAVPVRVITDDRGFQDALRTHGGTTVAVEALDDLSDQEREDRDFEVQYRHFVARGFDQVETLGAGSALGTIVWPLDTAFIALELAETAPRPAPGRSAIDVAAGKRIQDALHGRTRILLQGTAGSGKTTLMHWLAVRAAQGDLPSELDQLQARVPIVVPLRKVLHKSQKLPQVETLLHDVEYPSASLQPVGWLTRLLRKGRVLLLIDGIDEVPHDKRQAVCDWLKALLAEHEHTAVVVTSRPSAVPDSWLTASKFTGFSVLPMSPQDVGTFVDRWFAALLEAEGWSGYRKYAERGRRLLRAELDSIRPAAQMAANPRLCSLICALWLQNQGSLPKDPMSLHVAALRLLLEERDIQRGIGSTEGVRLDLGSKASLLVSLALWMTLNGATEMTESRTVRILEKDLRWIRPDPAGNAKSVLRHLLIRSGVLRETKGTVDFEHSTFRDFFAALGLVHGDHFGFLVNHAHDPHYEDIVRMAVGHCGSAEADQLLLELVQRGDREPEHRERIHLLATSSLEYAARADAEVRQEVLRRAKALVPPRDDAAAGLLAGAGAAVLDLLPGPDGITVEEARAVVLAAGTIGGTTASAFLKRFQEHDDPAVRKRVHWGLDRASRAPSPDTNGTAPRAL
ncbi:serine protease [Streptomyces rhizosphaericus]|uniref:NACHT domain-containing protein n=1 Tax=Streptomyces rhizosphaericus TaxID=114699 RepID=A0ABN1R590_9ACTN|nr:MULTISPECIES: serine protease [Streptomyces violaceusniger group]